jgi:hypothetical protein
MMIGKSLMGKITREKRENQHGLHIFFGKAV